MSEKRLQRTREAYRELPRTDWLTVAASYRLCAVCGVNMVPDTVQGWPIEPQPCRMCRLNAQLYADGTKDMTANVIEGDRH